MNLRNRMRSQEKPFFFFWQKQKTPSPLLQKSDRKKLNLEHPKTVIIHTILPNGKNIKDIKITNTCYYRDKYLYFAFVYTKVTVNIYYIYIQTYRETRRNITYEG